MRSLAGTERTGSPESNRMIEEWSAQIAIIENWYAGKSQFIALNFLSSNQQHLHGSGLKLTNKGSGIKITIT